MKAQQNKKHKNNQKTYFHQKRSSLARQKDLNLNKGYIVPDKTILKDIKKLKKYRELYITLKK